MTFNILVVGDMETGKTSFITTAKQGQELDLKFYEIPPSQRWGLDASLCDGYVICYNVTNQDTYKQAKNWLKSIRARHNSPVTILLAGTHADLDNDIKVQVEEASRFAEHQDILFAETNIIAPDTVTRACEILQSYMHELTYKPIDRFAHKVTDEPAHQVMDEPLYEVMHEQPHNPLVERILTQLNSYIHRITTKDGHIKNDFILFSSKQKAHRQIDCNVARELKERLELDPPDTSIFFHNQTIYSSELQSIVAEAKKYFGASSSSSASPY